jgi:CheY-like chemotaxis protein
MPEPHAATPEPNRAARVLIRANEAGEDALGLAERVHALGYSVSVAPQAQLDALADEDTARTHTSGDAEHSELLLVVWPVASPHDARQLVSSAAWSTAPRIAVLCVAHESLLVEIVDAANGGEAAGYLVWPCEGDALRAALASLCLVARRRRNRSSTRSSRHSSARKATRELARAARTAVHDINNALSAIRCNAFLIQTDATVSQDAKDAAGDILTAVTRGERTTSELSPLARAHVSTDVTVAELATHTARPLRGTPLPRPNIAASVTPRDEANRSLRTVLVVDDDHAVRRGVARSLRIFGLRVLEAGAAAQALELLASERIDLLLTDVVMPDRSGYELAELSTQVNPEMRVVFMSGYAPAAVPAPAGTRHTYPSGFLHKPFAVDALRRLVAELLPETSTAVSEPTTDSP